MSKRWSVLASGALLLLSSCEVVAGLSGTRHLQQVSGAGGGSCADALSPVPCAGGSAGAQAGGSPTDQAGAESGAAGAAGAAGVQETDGGSAGVRDEPTLPPHCREMTQCSGQDACTTLRVPGGTFHMGRSARGPDAYPGKVDETPEHVVTLSPFWLDKFEVSVGRFRRFVESYDTAKPAPGAGAHPKVLASGWKVDWNGFLPADRAGLEASLASNAAGCNFAQSTWTPVAGNSECRPMNCVDWYVSFAFCIWDGGRLPSEAEWEFAAAGGEEDRLYPWGAAAPDTSRATFGCNASGTSDCSPADIRPVGVLSALGYGRYGHADLAGSMLERTRDTMDSEFYALAAASGADAMNLSLDATRNQMPIRGGSYISDGSTLRATARVTANRSDRWDGVGWRCARNPLEP